MTLAGLVSVATLNKIEIAGKTKMINNNFNTADKLKSEAKAEWLTRHNIVLASVIVDDSWQL